MKEFEEFKIRILKNIDQIDISFEVGYCYKRACENGFGNNNYWTMCFYFLKSIALYQGVETYV